MLKNINLFHLTPIYRDYELSTLEIMDDPRKQQT